MMSGETGDLEIDGKTIHRVLATDWLLGRYTMIDYWLLIADVQWALGCEREMRTILLTIHNKIQLFFIFVAYIK